MWRELIQEFRAIREVLQEHERRTAASEMRGKIPSGGVDPKKGLCRVVIGKDDDGNDVLSPWVPYKQTAGAMKFHNPPSEGQVMVIRAEGGDVQQALAEPFRWNDDNPDPAEGGDEHVLTLGDTRVEVRGSEIVVKVPRLFIECGGTTFELTGGGLKAVAADYQWD